MEFNATFLVSIITFIVFVFLMNKVLYAPILNIMEERKKFIDDNYNSAKENDEKTNELILEKEEKLLDAKNKAKSKYNEIIENYKEQKNDIVVSAKQKTDEDLAHSNFELENISNDAKQSLKASMTDLANDIVEKVIGYKSEIKGFDDEVVNNILWEK